MACPQCQSDEISPAGLCLICGYQINGDAAAEQKSESAAGAEEHGGPIEVDYAGGAPVEDTAELPPWRQQLSQRLHEIKQKKESMTAAQPEMKSVPAPIASGKTSDNLASLQERLKKVPVRRPQMPPSPPPRQKKLEPISEHAQKNAAPADAHEIRNLIDTAILRQQASPPPASRLDVPAIGSKQEPVQEDSEGKLILLSRTLSGLVDLIIVVLCTGAFIIAADHFSGILALDYGSMAIFFLVFILIFFLYSIFFLAASNQTIGMMITDLRVVDAEERRPSLGQLAGRCCAYMLSFLCAGIGLLLGVFDHNSLCFHDRVSGTHIVRV